MNTAPEGHQGQLPALPQWRGAKGSVSHEVLCEPPSNRQHRAPAQAGRSGEGTQGFSQRECPSPTGLTLGASAQRPGRSRVAARAGERGPGSAPRRLWHHSRPPPPHRGGNSRTEEIAAGARPESSRPTRAAQGCRQIRAAPQDHRPPRPPTQGEKQEGNEEAGDHIQLKGQENSRKNKATNLFHLTDGESRKEIMKILKTVRRAIDGADSCKQN